MKMFLMLCAILISSYVSSQTWNEWFRQKQTKLKYIAQQIAAFQIYADYLKKGYKVVEKGWNTVNDLKHGDFDLHNNYFNSLKQVNSSIRSYDKVDGITSLQLQILKVNDAIKAFVKGDENIQSQERQYIRNVLSSLLEKCADNLDELKTLTTNGSLSLQDDERLKRIDDLYGDMQDKYAFVKYFQSSVQISALSRAKESNDISTSKLLYQIK